MKRKIFSSLLLVLFAGTVISGQVTEGEKSLRAQSADTTLGWKKGGIVSVNLAQTSLTNWAAGGQKSVAITVFSAVLPILKVKNLPGITHSMWDMAF